MSSQGPSSRGEKGERGDPGETGPQGRLILFFGRARGGGANSFVFLGIQGIQGVQGIQGIPGPAGVGSGDVDLEGSGLV